MDKQNSDAKPLLPGLYIVATPIGNLGDITFRALEVLKHSDYILCEDTRVTRRLLNHYNITKIPLLIYNDYSKVKIRQEVTQLIDQGKVLSLVSDAGTPLISDPGYKLIEYLRAANYHFEALPGPSAPITALVMSTLPTDSFFFGGFLPRTANAKHTYLQRLRTLEATLIFFESPHRTIESLNTMRTVFGNRMGAIARELTKIYQEVILKPLDSLIEYYNTHPLKGEVVICLAGYCSDQEIPIENLSEEIKQYMMQGLSTSDIVTLIKDQYPTHSKRLFYELTTKLKKSIT